MKNKGQALVEFVIILPIILLLVFGIIDFARIVHEKNELETISIDVVELYKNGKSENEIISIVKTNTKKDITLTVTPNNEYTTLELESSIEPITPGINKILRTAFDVSTKRVIYNE